jgi:hypothetical protein
MNQEMLDLLYRSFDSELMKSEQEQLQQALAASPELRAEKQQIVATRERLQKGAADAFKPFFLTRLNATLHRGQQQQEEFFSSLKWSFRLVSLVGALTVVFLFAYSSVSEQTISVDSLLGMPQVTLEDTWQLDILSEEDI